MPDLTRWPLGNLLGRYADLTSQHNDAMQAGAPELEAIEQDMAAVYNELERRTQR